MKYQVGEKVVTKGIAVVVVDYDIRHKEYTVQYSDGTRAYGVKENDIQSA